MLSVMKGLNRNRGFTLVELMAVVGIFGILIGAIYGSLVVYDSVVRTGLVYTELSENARTGIDQMAKELHNARRSTVSISSGGDSLSFQIPGSSNTIAYSLGGTDGRQLIRTEAGASTVLCDEVENIQFSPTPFWGSVVFITLETLKSVEPGRNLNVALNFNLKLRN